MPQVSIIVPCFNAANFLADTVGSVLHQSHADWELILVDDGSTDATWPLIQHWAGTDARIKAYRKPNGGTGAARNFGFAQTSVLSEYLWFLDHDDQLRDDALGRMLPYLEAHPHVGLVACQFEDVDAQGQRLGTGERSRWAPGWMLPRRLRAQEIETPFVTFFCATGQGPFALYRRSVYVQTEGWTTRFWPHEDTDMFCQMALLARVHCLPERHYLKRIHPLQGMNNWQRVQEAYAEFRAKWDNREPRSPQEALVLTSARRYYHATHKPFRHLKVAGKALGELLVRRDAASLRWLLAIVRAAISTWLIWRIAPARAERALHDQDVARRSFLRNS